MKQFLDDAATVVVFVIMLPVLVVSFIIEFLSSLFE